MLRSVLITRPEADAKEIAALVEEKNYQVVCEPFLEVIYHKTSLPDSSAYGGLVFTSANAVRAFCQNSTERDLSVFTVGDYTALEAKAAGFEKISSASGNIDDLEALLSQSPSERPYLYIRGEHISKKLDINDPKITIEEAVLYHTEKKQDISDQSLALLAEGAFSHILFFSTRTAESFVDITHKREGLSEGLKSSKALCLADSMLQCLSVLPWADVQVAGHPTRQGLLALLDD